MKSKATQEAEVFDEEYDDLIEKLAKAMVENLESTYSNEYEPFESYRNRVQLKFFKDIQNFCKKFKSGHQTLLEEVEKENPASKKK